jgi:ABC-type uncharacterized transport system involved in gliding motility auxiliary subunit
MTMASQEKKRKAVAETGFYLLVIIAIAVVANVISAGWYQRWDVTRNERYTLSKGSARLVQNLNSPIQVDAYVTRGLAQLDAFVRDLTDLLKEYERSSNGKFKFTVIEAKTEEQKEAAKEGGLQEMALVEAEASGADQASIAQGYMGLVFKYGSEKGVIPQLAPGRAEGLEFWVTNKIREVRDKAENVKHKIGVVSGKDELKLTDTNLVPKQGRGAAQYSIKGILEQAFPFYSIEEVSLDDGNKEIDPTLDGLIITQPRKDYTDKELRRIDEFLMRGGKSLVVYASAVGIKPQDPSLQASLNWYGLDKLLSGYGLDVKKNAVLDFGAQFRLPVMTQTGGIAAIRHPGIAHVINDPRFDDGNQLIDTGFAGFFRMDEVAFPFPSSIELVKDKQPEDVTLKAVARTTPVASTLTGDNVDMKMKLEWQPKPPYDQHIIAAVAEGKFKSAFGNGSKPEGDEIKTPERAPEPSRVLVVASSMFLTNPFAYAGNGPDLGGQFAMFGAIGGDPQLQMIAGPYAQRYLTNTIISVKNTLDWMSGDADLLAASAKILSEPNLTYQSVKKPKIDAEDDEVAIKKKDEEYRLSRKKVQDEIKWSLTLGVPLLFGVFGLIRWRWREGKKRLRKL